jgi:hypothetical protein
MQQQASLFHVISPRSTFGFVLFSHFPAIPIRSICHRTSGLIAATTNLLVTADGLFRIDLGTGTFETLDQNKLVLSATETYHPLFLSRAFASICAAMFG